MDSPKSVTVSWRLQYRLITVANPPEQGSVSPAGENWYDAGTEVALSASGSGIYGFLSWSGDLSGIVSPIDIIMDGPRNITANFGRPTLTIANPQGFDSPVPAVGTYTYDCGASVTCSITTPELYTMGYGPFTDGFETGMSGWTTGGNANWFVTDAEKYSGSYSARSGAIGSSQFTYIQRTFTIGPGGGQVSFWWKVSSRPAYHTLKFYIDGSVQATISGVTDWAQKTFSLSAGTRTLKWEYRKNYYTGQNSDCSWVDDVRVANTSIIDHKYTCIGYTGTGSCSSGTGTSVTFTIDTHSSLTWNWLGKFKLFTSVNPAGLGTVTVSSVLEWYDEGTPVQLTAVPSAGIYAFSNWSGDLTGSENPATIIMDGTKRITANFIPTPRAVVVTSSFGAPNPPAGTTYFPNGTSVTVSCGTTPYAGSTGTQYVNAGWTDGSGDIPATGSASSYGPFTITQTCIITWLWKTQYYLTTAVSPSNGGSITPGADWYDATTVISCNAIANTGYAFSNWSGNLTSTENPKDLTMDSPKSVTANFVAVPVADFTASPRSGNAPLTVQFTDTSSGIITSWSWDFDNNGTTDSTLQNPSYTYATPGTHTVKLTVTDPDGSDVETKTKYIQVYDGTVHVHGINGDDANYGTTWSEAVKTIQRGLDLAGNTGWTVLVANGTYTGTGNKDLNFHGKAIRLTSVGGATNCIIDCEGSGRGFYFHSGETADSIVEGFAIRNGNTCGGGIYCSGSSPTITECTIIGNTSSTYAGAGICCGGSSAKITNCTIMNNITGVTGGGIYCSGGSPTITDCAITGNTTTGRFGGGIYCSVSDCKIINCAITDNAATGEYSGGGGIFCDECSPTITNCAITGNFASRGGGIACWVARPVMTNCTIAGNTANSGGGICSFYGVYGPTLNNTILWGNMAEWSGNQISSYEGIGIVTLNYCDYADNSLDPNNIPFTPVTANNCIVADPQFMDTTNENYTLHGSSPCIDAGDNTIVTTDYDVDGNIRLVDGNNDTVIIVDIGAYEFQGGGNKAPVVAIESAPTGTTQNSTPTFTYLGTDIDGAVAGYWVSIDVNPPCIWTTDSSWTPPPLLVGFHTFYIQAQDDAGARSLLKSRNFIHDPTPDTRSVPSEYVTIQEAIDATDAGNTVLVSDGIYTGTGNKNLDFKGKAITVKSSGGAANCTIDCEGSGRGFYFHSGETPSSILDGFTVQNGNSSGIYCGSSPTITNCIITNNTAEDWGGGIYCSSYCIITNCIIANNRARGGGGIECGGASIINCIITNNTATGYGGGISCSYGGIINCIITGNTAEEGGGGIFWGNASYAGATNCTIANNTANYGGGIYYDRGYGGPVLNNTILWGNTATSWGNQIYRYQTTYAGRLNYCDYADNTLNPRNIVGSVMPYNCINSNPLFQGAASGNYRLQATSPCIDAGDNSLVPAGATDLDGNPRIVDGNTPPDGTATVDMGAYEYQP
jgi:PKD repeat protein